MHDAQEAMRIAERAEGHYNKAVLYAKRKEYNAELRYEAARDAKLAGYILGKSGAEIEADIYGKDDAHENL